ncbi:Prenyltransferase nscD [Trichinella pseudospiralis]
MNQINTDLAITFSSTTLVECCKLKKLQFSRMFISRSSSTATTSAIASYFSTFRLKILNPSCSLCKGNLT